MSIMDIFRGVKTAQQQQQTPPVQVSNNPAQNQPQMTTQQTAQTDQNGLIPQGSANPPDQSKVSPEDKFKDLWEPPKPDTSNPNSQNQPQGLDPKALMEAASKVDFTKVLSGEDLQKIAGGGQDAVQVFAQSLQKVSQQVYGQSVIAAAKITEAALSEAEKRFTEKLPQVVSRTAARDNLLNENPAFANPAVSPLVDMVQSQLAQKYPKATPVELNKMAKEYLQTAANVFNPVKSSADTTSGKSKEEDWDSYINS